MVWSSLAPKWPIPVPFCGMDHQKSNFSLISDTFSVGGCWGQPMSFLWKLVDKTQNLIPPKATRHHKSIKWLIILPLRADLLCTLHYETPCSIKMAPNPIPIRGQICPINYHPDFQTFLRPCCDIVCSILQGFQRMKKFRFFLSLPRWALSHHR